MESLKRYTVITRINNVEACHQVGAADWTDAITQFITEYGEHNKQYIVKVYCSALVY